MTQTPSSIVATPRPLYLQSRAILWVFLGGTLGTAAREALTILYPSGEGFPLALFLINISGAFLLGLLLESLLIAGPDEGWRRSARLTLGTGFLGGFTTYSAFALAVAEFTARGHLLLAIGYGLGSVIVGIVACVAGVTLAAAWRRGTGR